MGIVKRLANDTITARIRAQLFSTKGILVFPHSTGCFVAVANLHCILQSNTLQKAEIKVKSEKSYETSRKPRLF